jgi:hypothetical protein
MESVQNIDSMQSGKCVRCGVDTECKLGETWMCDLCYETRCSCCPEFGMDDLAKDAD